MSLRWRLGVILLVVSLVSGGSVAVVAYQQLQARFTEQLARHSMSSFIADAIAYYQLYGDWTQALAAENFHDFVLRRKAMAVGNEEDGPPDGLRPPPGRSEQPMPGLTGERSRGPSYRFILLDREGRVVIGGSRFRRGETPPSAELGPILPLKLDGKLIGSAVMQGRIAYSDGDLDYLNAMRRGLIWGGSASILVSLLVGLLLGEGLRRPLTRMTQAIVALGEGDLARRVELKEGGEIGELAKAFNKMGERLETQREELDRLQQIVEEQVRALEILSITDPLTGLHNRRHFDRQARLLFEQAIRYDQPFAVMLGDIDHFKQINDRFSHATGDLVLERVGALLRGAVRTSDVLARFGGEEFVIAFPQSARSEAIQLCDRLRHSIERADWSELHPELSVTISIGLCGDTALGSLDAMLQQADARLYQAKHGGRNQVRADPEPTDVV